MDTAAARTALALVALGSQGCASDRQTTQRPEAMVVVPAGSRLPAPTASVRELPAPVAWRLDNPRPSGANLSALWASPSGSLYALGQGALLRSHDGESWAVLHQGKEFSDRFALWGSSEKDIYVVGRTGILHSADAGATWQSPGRFDSSGTNTSFNFSIVWGTGPDNVIVGAMGSFLRSSDGFQTHKEWTVPPGFYRAIWGRGKDIFLVGSEPGARPFNPYQIVHSADGGKTWKQQKRGPIGNLNSIWGNDKLVITVGEQGVALRSTNRGASWEPLRVAQENGPRCLRRGLGARDTNAR